MKCCKNIINLHFILILRYIALNKANLLPLYMLNGSWQNILDIDSFETGLNNVNIDMSDFTLVRHLPENDAYFIVLK